MGTICKRLYFESHLRILFRFFRVLGLIHFKFNYLTNRFEHSRILGIVSLITNNLVRYMYGFVVFNKFMELLLPYIRTARVEYELTSVKAQDYILREFCLAKDYISALLYVCNYLRVRRILVPTINEIVDIYHFIRKRTDAAAGLYVDAKMSYILYIKLCITCCRLKLPFLVHIFFSFMIYDFLWVLGYAIPVLTFASYIYSQLFLTSVYLKMIELLDAADSRMDRRQMRKLIKELISLSHRIHCVKRKLNQIFKPIFLDTFVGAAFDINRLYLSLKVLFYFKYNQNLLLWNRICNIGFPACISYSCDAYLLGLLSDYLLQAEDDFRSSLSTISSKRTLPNRDVELVLFQRHVYGLGSVVLGGLKVDQQFAFDYAINIVLNFALTCLQFYAGEEVYATSTQQSDR